MKFDLFMNFSFLYFPAVIIPKHYKVSLYLVLIPEGHVHIQIPPFQSNLRHQWLSDL